MDLILDMTNTSGGIVALALTFLLASNAFLLGLNRALELIKDKTKTDLDNKAYAVINTVLGYIQIVIDFLRGNFVKEKKV